MTKHKTFASGLAAAAALAAGFGIADGAFAAEELQMSYFVGQRHPMVKAVVVPFQEKLAEVSGGELTVKVHFGGSLVKGGPPQYGALLQGVSDLAFSLPGYLGPKFPFSNVVTIPGVTQNAEDATNKLWNAMDVVETEYDAKIIALWAVDPKILLTRKPINALSDLKGLKIRVTSKQDEAYVNLLGAVSVASGVTVVHQNFTNGVIDGVHIGASAIRSFKLHEPAEYVVTNLPPSMSAIYVLMNQDKFNSLTPQQQDWINQSSGRALSLGGGRGYDRVGLGGVEFATKNNVKTIALSDAEKARWQAAMQPEVEKFLDAKINVSSSSSKIDITGREFVAKMNSKTN
jgi:TRAP-type C4-dicarboxylate transport system substrate-binding protein